MTQKMEILDKPKDKQLDYTSIKFYVSIYRLASSERLLITVGVDVVESSASWMFNVHSAISVPKTKQVQTSPRQMSIRLGHC